MKNAVLLAKIEALDLGCIKIKLMDKKEGKGWTRQQADRVEREYKRFLYLTETFRDTPIVPTTEVDAFWHQHILDTMKYAEDCQNVFGHFIHHFPYFGMRGEADALALNNAFEESKIIYLREFGEKSVDNEMAGTCNQCSSGQCRKGDMDSVATFARPVLA